jgi:uncharacterized repeat protein (TIGR01451 family)
VLRCGMRTGRVPGRFTQSMLVTLLLLLQGGACAVAGEDRVEVETDVVAEVRLSVTTPGGQETFRFVPATILAQGDVVYYTVRIRNPAPVPARDVQVVQRIPANTFYVRGSASGPGAEVAFSVDGGETFASANELTVSDPETRAVRRAEAQDYTHIRWTLRNPLAPSAVALARFRAVFR